jgi:hypothetical protein
MVEDVRLVSRNRQIISEIDTDAGDVGEKV